MEQKVINGLNAVGYTGSSLQLEHLKGALEEGPKNVEYTTLVHFLTNELRTLLNIDEEVNTISSPEDSVAFIMEVSSFLKELNCPYSTLLQGHVSDRLQNVPDRVLLLDYLLTELMGARILQERKPDKKIELKLNETEEAASLRQILATLRFPKPPPNITVPQLFAKLKPVLQTAVDRAGSELVGKPAFQGTLSDEQWQVLSDAQKDLHSEYKIRREMMLTRLDVTIQSFQWSDRTNGQDELFEKIYMEKRKDLKADPDVNIADLIAARDDIAIIEKTSNSSVRKNTKSSLYKIIIGQVPDRGGRTSEQAPPPPEMPSWQQRTAGPARGGRGRGGGYSRGDSLKNYSRGNSYGGNAPNYGNNSGNYGSDYSSNGQSYGGPSTPQNRNFDSAGTYGSGGHNRGSNEQLYSRGNDNYERRSFDSAGTYGRDQQYDQHNSKRVKTYDSYQSNRTTYADQYVQETQHNQQYSSRGNRGRGRSNYRRGGRNNY